MIGIEKYLHQIQVIISGLNGYLKNYLKMDMQNV